MLTGKVHIVMIIFNTDLDNTMIFSYKHDIGLDKMNVELYQGREISFITKKTHDMLLQVKEKVLFVPTTTRTVEQYQRIDLGIGDIKYALACNGGVLLIDGVEDDAWYQESLALVKDSNEELKKAEELLEVEKRRTFELRNIKGLFIFTKCDEPENVVEYLKGELDTDKVEVFNNGVKVYVVPKNLSKGNAIIRFKKYMNGDMVIAAGDSEFDITMFDKADVAIAPKALAEEFDLPEKTICMPESKVFSEEVLDYVLSCN